MLRDAIRKWPLFRQIVDGGDGTGAEAMSAETRQLAPKHAGASVTQSVCPYCAVGCGQLVYHENGRLLSIEGDPASPISEGDLCPKGAASYALITNPARLTTVRYRAPYATSWSELELETAMDMVAERVWQSRARSFETSRDGMPVMQCRGIAHLGGATLDNEENYLIKKLFTGGLGMTRVSNQARI
jgi:formate dehydrogenase major subunit